MERQEPIFEAEAAERPSVKPIVLDQTLWKRLSDPADDADFASAWLALQCRQIDGVRRGVLVLGEEGVRPFSPAAIWPERTLPDSALSQVAERALAERRGVAQADQEGGRTLIAFPVLVADRLFGVAALEIAIEEAPPLRQAMRHLQWGVAWVRERVRKTHAEADARVLQRAAIALELLTLSIEEQRFEPACRALVTDLARRFGCARVSIGFLKGGHAVVTTISHTAHFGKKMDLVRLIGAAMDEAIDQRAMVLHPASESADPLVGRAHAELARAHGSDFLLTVPLLVRGRPVGAITFERAGGEAFDAQTIELLEPVGALVGTDLERKRQEDRWLVTKAALSLRHGLTSLAGPAHASRKLAVAGAVMAVGFLYFATGEYRVTGRADLSGSIQRTLIAAYDGYVYNAPARPGDVVEEGQVLASLDKSELTLERLRWEAERAQRAFEHERALGTGDRVNINIAKTQMAQAEAQLALIDERIGRAEVRAPFDAVVVSGDLSQSIGAAVARGDVLFELAPLNSYRVNIDIDESQIADVEVGQTGRLLVNALPLDTFPFLVEKITPVAEAKDGRNVFAVEARIEDAPARLRPGMEGVAKIDVDERRLIWIWTRSLVDWARVFFWTWWP